jgi:hypothetical protein
MWPDAFWDDIEMEMRVKDSLAEQELERLRLIAGGEKSSSIGGLVSVAETRGGGFARTVANEVRSLVLGQTQPNEQCC